MLYEQIVSFDDGLPVHIDMHNPEHEPPRPYMLFPMHMHGAYELLLIKAGSLRCVTPKGEYLAEEGDILFVNSYTPHSTFDPGGNESHLMVQFNTLASTAETSNYLTHFNFGKAQDIHVIKARTPAAMEITESMQMIYNELANKHTCWERIVSSNILILSAKLQRHGVIPDYASGQEEKAKKIRPILERIYRDYMEPLSTKELAEMMNYNEIYFCRLFKSITGTTPIDFLNYVRICKAEQLLETDMRVSDIAYKTGFSTLSYFNKVFKKYKGISAGEYRKIAIK